MELTKLPYLHSAVILSVVSEPSLIRIYLDTTQVMSTCKLYDKGFVDFTPESVEGDVPKEGDEWVHCADSHKPTSYTIKYWSISEEREKQCKITGSMKCEFKKK